MAFPNDVHPLNRDRPVEGVRLGILVLDTVFRRLPGDVGNALSFGFPVQYRVVQGATPGRVVTDGAEGLLDAFVAAGRELVALGVDGLATTCGFLAVFQRELADGCGVPVATSSLLQVPMVQPLLPKGARVGVITIAADSLKPRHLEAVGVPLDTPIVGMAPDSAFQRAYIDGRDVPIHDLEAEMIAAAARLMQAHPEVRAIVTECANMPTFSDAITARHGVPVFDAVTMIEWFYAGIRPRRFDTTQGKRRCGLTG